MGVPSGVFAYDLSPEAAGFENIAFIDGTKSFASAESDFVSAEGDAFDFGAGVNAGIKGGIAIIAASAGFAKIDAAGEFSDNHEIHHASAFFEGGGVDERAKGFGRPEIGVKVQLAAKGEKPSDFWPLGDGLQVVPFWTANGSHKNGVTSLAEVESFWREWVTTVVIAGTAERGLFKCDINASCFEDFDGFCRDFGADSVSGENGDFE
jgi:hypothetical protein